MTTAGRLPVALAPMSEQDGLISYASAGVDIEAGDRAVELIKPLSNRATRPEVRGGLGGRLAEHAAMALPGWLSEADIDAYAEAFRGSGFRGGLNWYRNIDRNWELMRPFAGLKVTVPALYVAGDRDLVLGFAGAKEMVANLARAVPDLREAIILPGCGHWTQQERPAEVNAAMVGFLRGL